MSVLRLLTVDDEKHIHAGLDAIVDWGSIGYEHVGAALNGAEALRIVSELSPDVVLTDIRMPGVDGLELIEKIRDTAEPQPAIVVISGYGEFEYARAALRHGVRDYLLKPIEEDDLIRVLSAIRDRFEMTKTRADAREAHGARGGSSSDREPLRDPQTSAVCSLLAGTGGPGAVDRARGEISATGDGLLAVVCLYDVRNSIHQVPLSAAQVRSALAEGKAQTSSRWVIDDDAVAFLVLIPDAAARTGEYRSWMKGLKNVVETKTHRTVVLWVSDTFADASEIHDVFLALKESIGRASLIDPSTVVIPGDDLKRAPTARLDVGTVVSAMEDADCDRACSAALSVLREAYDHGLPIATVREWLAELRVEVRRMMADLDAESVISDREVRFAMTQVHALSPGAVSSVVQEYLRAAATTVAALRRANRDGVVALMRRRIDRDYARDLSIASMAAEYGMNPGYLGQLFKKKCGYGFKTALRRRRVREARLLLESTDLLIPEIARAVGYKDTDFFTDQFKRELELTPGQYRDRLR